MKVLVTGVSGMVGLCLARELAKRGNEIVGAYRSRKTGEFEETSLDISNSAEIEKVVESVSPDAIIHCAAMTDVDECERKPEDAMKINASATASLAKAAEKNSAKMAYISTSFVFGNSAEPLNEDAKPNPLNAYGKSKLEGEKKVREAGDHLILRIDQPYGWVEKWQKQNMVTKTIEKLEANKPFKIIDDWHNCPTYLKDLAAMCGVLLEKDEKGTFNCTGPERISRYEWARVISGVFGYDSSLVEPVKAEEFALPAKRPDVCLDCGKARKTTGIRPHGIKEALMEMKAERMVN